MSALKPFLYVLLSSLISQCLSEINQCNITDNRDSSDEFIWYSTSDFIPQQGKSYCYTYLGHINTLEFNFTLTGRTTEDSYEMFLRVGFDAFYGTGCNGQQSQYPSIFLTPDDYLRLYVSDSDSCATHYDLDDYEEIESGVDHHIFIYWDDDTFSINITGGNKDDYYRSWNKTAPRNAHMGRIVPVWWMSSKFGSTSYYRGNGTFSNITITSREFGNGTFAPTTEPTTDPTTDPTELLVFESTFENTGITEEEVADDDDEESDTALILFIVGVLVLLCGGLWYYNKRNKRADDEIRVIPCSDEGDEETTGSPKQKKKKGPIRPLRDGPEELQAGDSIPSYVIGSQNEKVFHSVGMVGPSTHSDFRDATILESPRMAQNDSATYSSQFIKPESEMPIHGTIEMGIVDEENEVHPSPDVDDAYDYPATEDAHTQMLVQEHIRRGPPPKAPMRKPGPPQPAQSLYD